MTDIADTSTQLICDALGRKRMAERLGVGLPAISNAAADGQFPAKWFAVLRDMCAEAGVECPEALFKFIGADPVAKAS